MNTNSAEFDISNFGLFSDQFSYSDDYNTPYLDVREGQVLLYYNDGCSDWYDSLEFPITGDGTNVSVTNFFLPEAPEYVGTAELRVSDSKLVIAYDFPVEWGTYSGEINCSPNRRGLPLEVWTHMVEVDWFEPDSAHSPAHILSVNGEPFHASIHEDDVDYYRFTPDTIGYLYIYAAGPGLIGIDKSFNASGSESGRPGLYDMHYYFREIKEYDLSVSTTLGCAYYTIQISSTPINFP